MTEVNERIRASFERMKARKLGLAKFMFLRADCRGLKADAAEDAWTGLSEEDRKRLVRYADAAMSGLSVDYSRQLGCDRFAPETPTPAAGPEATGLAAQAVQGAGHANGTNPSTIEQEKACEG